MTQHEDDEDCKLPQEKREPLGHCMRQDVSPKSELMCISWVE